MKLYFHLHLNPSDSLITAVVQTQNKEDDLKSCLKQLCRCLLEKRNLRFDIDNIQLFNEKKKSISHDSVVSSFVNGIDITVKINEITDKNKVIYEKSDIRKISDGYTPAKPDISVDSKSNEILAPLLKKAQDHVTNKRHDLALSTYKEILKDSPNNFDALFGSGYIYFNAERYNDCITYFEKLISKGLADEVLLLDFSRALTYSGDPAKAASVISRCINDLKRSNKPVEQIHDANVALGEALEHMGQLPNAFQLYLTVSQMTEKQHLSALIGYARIGYQINHVSLDDVFIVILNAAAHKKNDRKFLTYFADMVKESGGYEALHKQMHDLWLDPQTVLYICTFLRENGALEECLKLTKHAFSLDSSNVNIALLIFHIHENLCSIMPAFNFVAEFFNGMLERQVIRKIDLSPFVKVLRYIEKNELTDLETYLCQMLAPEKEAKSPSPKGNLSDAELDLLALYFTVVKICYINGYLRPMSLLIKVLDPLFKLNDNLHKTSIRNEQAYYTCISKMYESVPPSNYQVESSHKLYFVGDSHVLPAAWRTIKGNDNDYLLHPILVTGLKVWHLRKESKFYTKFCFQQSIKKIPQGATCIFVFGEIDCREGVSSAVRKCVYESIDESMKALVEIYVKNLTDVQKKKKAKVFVHPVPPVLSETIENVRKFNEQLKNRILKTPKLFWLDFIDELLNEKGLLKDMYEFDGAHLHPDYLSLLEDRIKKQL